MQGELNQPQQEAPKSNEGDKGNFRKLMGNLARSVLGNLPITPRNDSRDMANKISSPLQSD